MSKKEIGGMVLNFERRLEESGRGIFFDRVETGALQGLFLANRSMGFDESLKILRASDLKMPGSLDIIRHGNEDKTLLRKITGRFWVGDSPEIGEKNTEYVFKRDRLIERGGNMDINRTVFIHDGNSPFMLEVHGDQYTNYYRRRFDLYGRDGSDMIPNMIVGIRDGGIIPMKILGINPFSEARRRA
jgi:hypothetical protein